MKRILPTTARSVPHTRRRFLRGCGVALALPWLESNAAGKAIVAPQRMLLISNNLGVLPKPFFPSGSGRDYELSPYLESLAPFRDDFTVFSGLSHPDVDGGHSTENCFLTAARGPTKSGFRNTISLDQFAADRLGPVTRYPTLNIGVNIDKANRSLSWTRDGALLPAEDNAQRIFERMYIQADPPAIQKQLRRMDERKSILDTLLEDAGQFRRDLGALDQRTLDQYLTSVREVEQRIAELKRWELRPKPTTDQSAPENISDRKLFFQKFDLMLSLARLALQTDSTRIVTLMVDAFATPAFQLHENQNTTEGYHNLSHHGHLPAKLAQLEDADRQQMALLEKTLRYLAEERDGDARLLDNTMVLYGSNMGDANTHMNTNLPILLAGGRLRHGRHLAFSPERNVPLANLFVTMLNRLGVDVPRFASSSGTLSELEA